MASLMRLVTWICAGLLLAHSSFVSAAITTPLPDLYEASLTELQAGLTSGQFNTVDLVKARPFTLSCIQKSGWLRRPGVRG